MGRYLASILWTAPLWLMGCQENSLSSSNSDPTVTINSHFDGDQVVEGFAFTVRATAGDPDNASEDLVGTWYVGNDLVPTCNKMPVTEDGLIECEVVMYRDTDPSRVQVEVRDPRNATASDHRDLEVVEQSENIDAPTAEIIQPADQSVVLSGEPTIFEGHVSDLLDPPTVLGVEWVSSLDGILSTAGADSSGTVLFVQPTLSSGLHSLELRVTDTEGNFTRDITTFTVNGAPTAPVVSIAPDPPSSSQDLTTTIDSPSIDPDGDGLSYTYEWLKDGIPQSGQTSALVLATDTRRGETWTVRVHPFDGLSTGPYGEDSVVIQNAAPVVQSATITPSPAYTDSVLSASVVTDDADGDTVNLRYDWHVNGVTTGQTGATLDGLVWFDRGDIVQVWVTPNDGSTDGAQLGSNAITIQNAPPTPPGVDVAPAAPLAGTDDLYCTMTTPSTDPDGDSVTYQYAWDVNGASYPRGGDAGPYQTTWPDDTADGQDTTGGETWTCSITAVDGGGLAGTPGRDSVVVGSPGTVIEDFDIQPDISYTCAFFSVRLDVQEISMAEVAGDLYISGAPSMQGVLLSQSPAPTGNSFDASGILSGGCIEEYRLQGNWITPDHFDGTFYATFTVNSAAPPLLQTCGNCTNQSWPVDGYLIP